MYDVVTMGRIGDLPAGWAPANTGLPGVVAGPPLPLTGEPEHFSAMGVALIAAGALIVGAVGVQLWGKYGKRR